MDERIWSLPGPRTLITDTLSELKSGRHAVLALPAAMAADPAITDSLSDAVGVAAGIFTTARRIFADPDADSLLDVLARAVDIDDPPATVPQLLSNYQGAGLTFIVVAADHSSARQTEFPKFLERVEQETHSAPTDARLSLVVIGGRQHLPSFRGGEDSDVSLATLWWWNRIARWDTAAHISHIDGPRLEDRILADIRAETIVEVARWDLTMAEHLAQEWSGDPEELSEHLSGITTAEQTFEHAERCGSRPNDMLLDPWDAGHIDGWHDRFAPAPSAQRIDRLVWAAQARIILPWIEQRREKLQERTIRKLTPERFNEALRQLITTPLTDEGLVEIGQLHLIINARLGRHEPAMRSTARRLRDARNKLAHLDPLDLAELCELVNSCRGLY